MRKYLLLLFAFGAMIIALNSCKLDAPILPGQPGYVAQTPPVTNTGTGTGTSISYPLLNGVWTVTSTSAAVFSSSGAILQSSPSSENFFDGVLLDDTTRTALFDNSIVIFDTPGYAVSKTGANIYIQLSEDPFSRSSNTKIQITNLTATTMNWIAIDPAAITSGGTTTYSGYEVTFTK